MSTVYKDDQHCMHTMQCSYFISDFEDDLIMLFQEGLTQAEIEKELCHDITGKP